MPHRSSRGAGVSALTSFFLISHCLLSVLSAGSAHATTVARDSVESLSVRAELVVRGRVEGLFGYSPVRGFPYRLARVRVLETIAGQAPAEGAAWVRLPGGSDQRGRVVQAGGIPELATGDELVLFLERVPAEAALERVRPPGAAHVTSRGGRAVPAEGPAPAAQWLPLGLSASTYHVDRSAGPAEVVLDPAARGLGRAGPRPAGQPVPARASLDVLLRSVRQARAGGTAPGSAGQPARGER